jgi:hypothetical protein
MSEPLDLQVEGHSPGKPTPAAAAAVAAAGEETSEPATSTDVKGVDTNYSEETKKEVYSLAEKILASASEKSGGETEKKLIAAVMAVHMKYAESLHVIENLIRDRKTIDDRVQFLEGQLKGPKARKGDNRAAHRAPAPPPGAPPGAKEKPSASAPRSRKGARNPPSKEGSGKKPVAAAPPADRCVMQLIVYYY